LNDKIEFLEIERIIEKEIKDDKYMEIPYTLENVVSVSLSLMKEILSRYGVD
jgi:1-deoxy-D-xylulose 5-phosphate reductoisomerase